MDLREKKTLRSIKNAFLEIRGRKPLERITVKELCELAEISKTTFYLHYKDIYDLSEALQNEVIKDIIDSIPHPEYFLADNTDFTYQLFSAFHAQESLINILFSGNQSSVLSLHIEQKLKALLKSFLPSLDPKLEVMLTYHVQGGYYAYRNYCSKYDFNELAEIIISLTKPFADLLQ